jgi:hypothetical protein
MNETLAKIKSASEGVCLLSHSHRCGCDGKASYLVNHPTWVNPLSACLSIGDAIGKHSNAGMEAISFRTLAKALDSGDQRGLPEWARMWLTSNIE